MAKMTYAERVLIGRFDAMFSHSRYDSRELVRPAREAFDPRSNANGCISCDMSRPISISAHFSYRPLDRP